MTRPSKTATWASIDDYGDSKESDLHDLRLLKELDKVTKQTTDELDALLETKQKEIMEV